MKMQKIGGARLLGSMMANADPATVLRDLNAAMSQFRTNTDARIGQIEASHDSLARRLAAADLSGGNPLLGSSSAATRAAISALGQFARSGDVSALQIGPQAAMSGGSDPDGGYLVPEEVSTAIIGLQQDISPLRRLARVVPTRSCDYRQPVSKHGVGSGWVGEGSARPETNSPQLAMLNFPAGQIYANPGVSQDLLDDSDFNLGMFLAEEISKEFDAKEGAAFASGDGINKPRGFLTHETYVASGDAAFGKVQVVLSGHATELNDADKLIDLLHTMKAGHRRSSTWLMNSATQAVIAKLKDSEGRFIWQQALSSGMPDTLLGRPVELDENMPDIGAGELPIALANWRDAYLINDRMGVRVLRDPYSNKPNVMFYTTRRVGGGILDSEAIKLLKIAAA